MWNRFSHWIFCHFFSITFSLNIEMHPERRSTFWSSPSLSVRLGFPPVPLCKEPARQLLSGSSDPHRAPWPRRAASQGCCRPQPPPGPVAQERLCSPGAFTLLVVPMLVFGAVIPCCPVSTPHLVQAGSVTVLWVGPCNRWVSYINIQWCVVSERRWGTVLIAGVW